MSEEVSPLYLCPNDSTLLLYVLKGGAGFCLKCRWYVQAAGVPMPELPTKPAIAKPERKKKAKKAKKARNGRTKKTKRAPKKRQAVIA